MKIVVEIVNGTLQSVYTDYPGQVDVEVKNFNPSQYDTADYEKLALEIREGTLRSCGCMHPEIGAPTRVLAPDPGALLLIDHDSRADTELGCKMQNTYSAFIDGYLTGTAELERYINSFYRDNDKAQIGKGLDLYRKTEALRKMQHKRYDDMVRFLNTSENFDGLEEEGQWFVTDDSCAQVCRQLNESTYELMQICEVVDRYHIAHMVIDTDEYSKAEIAKSYLPAYYGDQQQFVRSYGGYQWRLVAEMIFETEALNHLEAGSFPNYDDAVRYIRETTDCGLD